MSAIITHHANARAKERLSWSKPALARMAARALEHGTTHAESTGSLKRYLDGLYLQHRNASNLRIYGHQVFLFAGVTLVTVLQLPQRYQRTADKKAGSSNHRGGAL